MGEPLADAPLPPPVLRSWLRSQNMPCTPAAVPMSFVPTAAQTVRIDLVRPVLEDVYQFIAGSGCVVLFTDPCATVLFQLGDDAMCADVAAAGIGPGAALSEAQIGTLAVNLALHEAQPMQTVGYEHFCAHMHPFACAAAPVFDVDGQAIGVLAIMTRANTAHTHTLGMIIAASQTLQAQLRANALLAETHLHLSELHAAIEAMNEGLMFIDTGGHISSMNTRAGQMLNLHPRNIAGQRLEEVLELPEALRQALTRRTPLTDQEFLFAAPRGAIATLCSVRPVRDTGQRHLGMLLTLRPTESVHRMIQQMVGARAHFTFADVLGESPAIQAVVRKARSASTTLAPVLICGEYGTGKKLLAHAIHNGGLRADGPFVVFDCAPVPRALLLPELLGQEGAHHRPGRLELAQGGTLLIESVEALSMDAQTALLRAIETGHLVRVGGRRAIPLNVRIIAVSRHDLARLTLDGRFRAELATLLSTTTITMPLLRERGDDILLLVNAVLTAVNRRLGKHVHLAPDALAALVHYRWPGNARELETTLERLIHATEASVLNVRDLPAHIADAAPPVPIRAHTRLYDRQIAAEREAIIRAGRAAGGHLGRVAEELGISRATLWRKMRLYGIDKTHFWQERTREQ